MTETEKCARAHGDLARAYERIGNVRAAMELRRVENLLWALVRGESWTTILPALGTETVIDEDTKVWWHGCWDRAGHFLFGVAGQYSLNSDAPACARENSWLDGGWAPRREASGSITFVCRAETDVERRRIADNTTECEQGLFLMHRVHGGRYTIMSWWDRTHGDRRGGCNSCYIVEGMPSMEDMLKWFPIHFPLQAKHLADAGVTLVPARLS
jgi:hypothetical protein